MNDLKVLAEKSADEFFRGWLEDFLDLQRTRYIDGFIKGHSSGRADVLVEVAKILEERSLDRFDLIDMAAKERLK